MAMCLNRNGTGSGQHWLDGLGKVTPSWHGDAVGHYEGDTLVIDTVGIKPDRPYAMIDLFGTPYTEKLHVVERYRLVDREVAKADMERATKENWRPAGRQFSLAPRSIQSFTSS